MKLDVLGNGRFKLYADYDEWDIAAAIGGKWNSKYRWWTLNKYPDPAEYPGMSITPRAMAVIRTDMAHKAQLKALQGAKDVSIAYGDGIDDYQRVGIKFLVTARRSILGDRIGLGKSVQFIRACHEVGATKVLLITKKSYIHNMQKQIKLWSVNDRITWDLTNYEQVARHPERYPPNSYDVIIIDEAIALKNRKAKRTMAIKRLCAKVPYVWLITGTIIRNKPGELWSLLNILYPGKYSSYWAFVNEYCVVETNHWGGTDVGGLKEGVEEALSDELSSVLIRRSKDIIDLPPLTEEVIYIANNALQKSIYKQLLEEFYVILGDSVVRTPTVLAQLTRLRQLTCCPSLIGGKASSSKTETILSLVEDYASDNKLIIFTTYKPYAEQLGRLLAQYGSVIITGDVPVPQRNAAVEQFDTDNNCRILIGTYGAMSESLNIQTANIVIHANPEWVPDQIEQATGRAWRRGQTRPVHAIHLVTEGTIEEHVVSLLTQKRKAITELDIITQLLQNKGG